MNPLPFAVSFKKQMFRDIQYPDLNSRSVFVCKYKGRMAKHTEVFQNACVLYLIFVW